MAAGPPFRILVRDQGIPPVAERQGRPQPADLPAVIRGQEVRIERAGIDVDLAALVEAAAFRSCGLNAARLSPCR